MRGRPPRTPLFSCPGPSRVGSLYFQAQAFPSQAESAIAPCGRGPPLARPPGPALSAGFYPLGEAACFSKSSGNEFVTC